MATTIKLIEDQAELSKAIKSIHTRGQKLQQDIHRVACSVLHHIGKHKDVRVASRFIQELTQAMPEMSRVNSLKQWFEAFGPVRFATTEEIEAGSPAVVYLKDKKLALGDAMAKPFWKFKALEGAPYVPLDMNKEIDRMIKRLEKDAAETSVDHSAMISALRGASSAYIAH